jgi:hypothetical protein
MGFIVTYSTQDSNTFANGKTISYLTTNFPLSIQNLTWNTDPSMTLMKTSPLRVNHIGPLRFLLNVGTTISDFNNGGFIYVILQQYSISGEAGGFAGS